MTFSKYIDSYQPNKCFLISNVKFYFYAIIYRYILVCAPRHFKANNLNEDTRRFYKSIIARKRILTLNKITIFNAKALSNICTKRKLRVKCICV